MKACGSCGRLYPNDAGFCPVDGAALASATQVPVLGDAQDPKVGQLVCERYHVRRVVADGGMGRVYEALDMQERRNVALKILHADVARDEVAVERFKREFSVSKTLPHQHIVEVLNFQPTTDGTYALAMEFLYGEELRATLKRESVIPPARVVRMISQVALALDAAHAMKLVHRDLKPDNLFLCQTREGDIVKILDFGSVKDKGESAKKLTVLGTTIGSPFYMAPEQAQGLETLDHRADVWALAAIIYECVTGRVPFAGNNGPSILLEILTKEPKPPSEVGKNQKHPVPPTLDAVMAQAFRKMPAMRVPSVGALADLIAYAYGLEGTHTFWAQVPEGEIAQRIQANMPALMQAAPAAPEGAADAADSFFGEADALATGMAPTPAVAAPAYAAPQGYSAAGYAAAPPPPPVPGYSGQQHGDFVPAGVTNKGPSAMVLLAVGGGALLLGAVVVLVFVLFG
jgi:tRNA A-37 threonylcarbamoyl transferase component Bud32